MVVLLVFDEYYEPSKKHIPTMLNFLRQNFIEKHNFVFKKKQDKSRDLAQNFPKLILSKIL